MFIAHLPAGYLGACLLTRGSDSPSRRGIFLAFLIGSILPDLDMLYFYLIDQGRHLHHHYWTHLPVFWIAVLAVSVLASVLYRRRHWALLATALVGGVFLHLVLDTPFAGILWLYPWSERDFHWLTVPATRNWWVWSFVFHWSFLFEVAICVAAAVLFVVRRRKKC